ncbi:hypothetical protein B5S28_g4254 [[Candida] boidinii]|uniref:Unnamed protein product n=1 Tax=Candida boidinii TaxID=5477 RepID=A0ACB5TJC2_CANBO|nr:hypothetical protein B5S28_g4254 [[Candida] boidinii]OWB63741.1 hypothetical protein B5S29_g4747 [[Candida] boidinii]OWB74446.1 hypothetical protein B5S31_g4240 [[Candida] boidinii]GME89838.1 unnamed protein product [[Candida] boidinii]GMF04566.1 unnamed protein product [[Candida] boidinii]
MAFGLRKRKGSNEQQEEPEYDGMESSDSLSDSVQPEEKKKSHRPAENAFRQQKLKAYHPILTPKTIIPLLLAIAVVFIPLGAGMLYGANRVEELVIDYTYCESNASTNAFSDIPEEYYDYYFHTPMTITPKWKYSINESETYEDERGLCEIQFQIPNDIGPSVYLFYRLKNFYANHRRYVKSFSEDQLHGTAASLSLIKDTVGQNCEPLSTDENGKKIYPCGLIANSLYNDTYTSPVGVNGTSDYDMTREGIAWATNKNRFKMTKYNASEVVPPPNWIKSYPDGYTEENMPDISTWYEFQNWMAPSALALFSKMVLRNDHDKMVAGTYQITAGLHFPVTPYDGRKYIYLSTRSVTGGKNPFLGIAWIVGGAICLVLSLAFLIVNILHPRKLGDVNHLSWVKAQQKQES